MSQSIVARTIACPALQVALEMTYVEIDSDELATIFSNLEKDFGNAALNLPGRLFSSRMRKTRNMATVSMVVMNEATSARIEVANT